MARRELWTRKLIRPPALIVALGGLILTALILAGPLEMYQRSWFIPLMISAIAYYAIVSIPAPRRRLQSPLVAQAVVFRDRIASYRPRAEELGATRLIDRFLETVDTVTIPELERLARSQAHVHDRLRGYERAAVKPDAATLSRLHTLADQQQAAAAGALQQLANSDAAIVGAIETGDTSRLTDEINLAVEELQRQWQVSRDLSDT
ncbi:MAG TPA: hypothetical protein VHL09_06340 [Dehalococcoidia bacterium]|nr:hypothetical protein [Dehalococcoidia bacterium]